MTDKFIAWETNVGAEVQSEDGTKVNKNRRELTDLGNAERLVDAYGDRLVYSHEHNAWFTWDGRRWRPDVDGAVERMAKTTVRLIRYEAADAGTEKEANRIWGHAMRSESRARLDAMIRLAHSETGIPVAAADLDANPWLVNFTNGTMDLRTGELRNPDPSDLMTKSAAVAYKRTAKCPRWRKFLKEVLPDPEMRSFVKRAVGYTLTGSTEEHVLFLVWGSGRNGKSKFIEAVLNPLGDYGYAASSDLLLQSQQSGRGPSPEVASLQGRRMITSAETDEGRRMSEALVKQLTGGDRMNARLLYSQPVEFDMLGKIYLVTNSKPLISGQNVAIWERILPIHFQVRFEGPGMDKRLSHKLAKEAEGVMRWAVEGCLEWQADGLNPPLSVLADRDDYKEDMDVVGQFVEERCVTGPKHVVPSADLFAEWSDWCRNNGLLPGSSQAFSRRIQERGFAKVRRRFNGPQRQAFEGLDLRVNHEPLRPLRATKKGDGGGA